MCKFELKRLYLVRKYIIMLQVVNFLFSVQQMIEFDTLTLVDQILQIFYIVVWLIIAFGLYLSYMKNIRALYFSLVLLTFRNAMPLLNLENEKVYYTEGNAITLLVSQLVATLYSITLIANLFIPYKWLLNTMFSLMTFIGLMHHVYHLPSLIYDTASLIFVICMTFLCLGFQTIFLILQSRIANEVFQEILNTEKQKQELQVILDTLEEGIIILDEDRKTMNYCNNFCVDKLKQSLDLETASKMQLTENFYQDVGDLKILQEYDRDGEGEGNDERMFSIEEVLDMSEEERSTRVFFMHKRQASSQQGRDDELQPSTGTKEFVQIKEKSYYIEGSMKRLVQIIDISKSILYDKEHAKSELLSLINVTVSHEMRNPLNSILSLNVDFDDLIKKFERFN